MIDQQGFRQLMAGVCAPVTVVTTIVDGVPYGATVSSLASLSLDPPLVSVAFDRASNLLARIQQAGEFAVDSSRVVNQVFACAGAELHQAFFDRI